MQSILTRIDCFGAEEKLLIHPQTPVQRSSFGGVMTIILYGTSLAYFLYEIIDWQNNNKLPKITTFQKEISQGETLEPSGRFFEITQYPYAQSPIDPFDPDNLILFPIVFKMDGSLSLNNYVQSQFETVTINGLKKNRFYMDDLWIKGSPMGTSNESIEYVIILGLCNQSMIASNFKCANETTLLKFQNQVNYINLVFYISQFDTKTQKLYKIPKSQKALLMLDQILLYQFSFGVVNLQTDDGILFTNMKNFTYASDFSFASQQVNRSNPQATNIINGVLTAYITMGQIKQEILIEYPKISEILADTGSIISWILQISYVVFKYNEALGNEKTIKKVIKIYFPDFENLIIKKNIFGKFLGVNLKNSKYDPQKVQTIFKQISSIAEQKVNFINLQYEVSRLQFLMTETLGINEVINQIGKQRTMETLLEVQGCKLQELENSEALNIVTKNPTLYKVSEQDNAEMQTINQINKNEFDLIESSIGLLLLKDCKSSIFNQQNTNLIDQSIYPQEELKVESISHINSIH